jgi:mono/diheme cytochrome c family protein
LGGQVIVRRLRALLPILAIVVLLSALALWIYANARSDWQAPPEAKALKNPVPANERTLAAAKVVYAERCSNCHGEKGDGNGGEAMMYFPEPSDFTDPALLKDVTDGEIFWKISEGRRPMPSFKDKLSEEERWELVDFLRTFAKPATSDVAPAKQSPKNSSR